MEENSKGRKEGLINMNRFYNDIIESCGDYTEFKKRSGLEGREAIECLLDMLIELKREGDNAE
jgi:hypothetical protein